MELAEHAKMVMSTLDEGIKSLDDVDTFLTYLHEVGASHTKIPGFNRQYFWVSPREKCDGARGRTGALRHIHAITRPNCQLL